MQMDVKVAKLGDEFGLSLYRWATQQPEVRAQILSRCEQQARVCNAEARAKLTFPSSDGKTYPYQGDVFSADLHTSVGNARIAGVVYCSKDQKHYSAKRKRVYPNPAYVAVRRGALHW